MSTFYTENIKYCKLIRKERLSGLIITHNYPSTFTCINSSYVCLWNPYRVIRLVAQMVSTSPANSHELRCQDGMLQNLLLRITVCRVLFLCCYHPKCSHRALLQLAQVNDKSLNSYHNFNPVS